MNISKKEGLVSVIIPAYNAGNFIERAISSALSQTYRNIEVLVIDDGSTDNTSAIVRKLREADLRLRYYYQENRGLSYTRNRLCALSQGEYIAFLDHDDEWFPEKTEIQLGVFQGNRNIAMVYADVFARSGDGREFRSFQTRRPRRGNIFYKYLLEGNFIPLLSVIVKKDILTKYLPFNTEFKAAEEWDIFLKISKENYIEYIDNPVGIYHIHNHNLTSRYPARELQEMLMIMDYWGKHDFRLSSSYRHAFLLAKSKIILQNTNFSKRRRDKIKHILESLKLSPLWPTPYLKLIKTIFYR